MEILNVALGDRSYPIHVGPGLLDDAALIREHLGQPRAVVVSNETVAPLYLARIQEGLLSVGVQTTSVILPDGEQYKDWQHLNQIFDALLAQRCERTTSLIALGGGVVGDMTGFAAACYQRGMPFIQIPTTLLSQVDSSVGGKTAINHPMGKNMIGAFYQPRLVLADTETLRTLPSRELSAGLAEVIKYGLIRDLPFLDWIEANLDALRACEPAAMAYAIYHACRNKAEVVVADEFEQRERAVLNLGHTFGHAIETGMGYGAWLHGEAVAAGTLMAAELSCMMGWISGQDVARIERLMVRAGLPISGPNMPTERYLELMRHDKKVKDGKLRLVLLKRVGQAVVSDAVPSELLVRAIEARVSRG